MLVVLSGLATLAVARLRSAIRTVAVQSLAFSVLLIAANADHIGPRLVALAVAGGVLKVVVFPWLLSRSIKTTGVQNEGQPYIGFALSLALGAAALAAAFGLAGFLQLPMPLESELIVPVSIANVFFGLILLVGRRQAISQVLGYLVLENGIFVFSLALATELPALVELGVLLDLFVAVFVMGITIYQISREFDHIDASRLRDLTDQGIRRRRWPFGFSGR